MKYSCAFLIIVYLFSGDAIKVLAQETPLLRFNQFAPDTNQIKRLISQSLELYIGSPDKALSLLSNALKLSKEANYKNGIVTSYLGIGNCKMIQREYMQSEAYFDSAYFYAFTEGRPSGRQLAVMYNYRAALYSNKGNDAAAIRYYYLALQEMNQSKINDTSFLIMLYDNIGGTFIQLKQQDKALYYLKKGVFLAKQFNEYIKLANLYTNMGMSYQNLDDYSKSLEYLHKAEYLYKTRMLNRQVQHVYYGIGRNYLLQDSVEKAYHYFHLAVNSDTLIANNNSPLLQGLGGVNFLIGNYNKAEKYYKAALVVCETQGLLIDKLTIFATLAKIYTKTQKYQLANQYQLAYSQLSDSINNEKRVEAVNQLEVKYRVSEKDKELAQKQVLLLKQQSRIKEKNIWIASISGAGLLLITVFISIYKNRRQKERLQQEHIRSLEKEQEISELKAKMKGEEEERTRVARELHDGVMVQFSAVKMNLSVLPEEHKSLENAMGFQKIIDSLDKATRELRRTAHNLLPDVLLEGGLSEAVFYFCQEMQQSTGLAIDFQQFVDLPQLQPEIELSVYRIIQELLQNVMKHADATQVILQLSNANHLLNITIEDDGKGFDMEDSTKKTGIGFRNIRSRIAALGGQMDVRSSPDKGTTIYLEIDIGNYTLNPFNLQDKAQ